ncbi:MAG TPA: hypothetical protein VMG35_06005 [Bryobacteraceae bacterium]|nr:hypothetical protein [Bryobacteraceae bacterium]
MTFFRTAERRPSGANTRGLTGSVAAYPRIRPVGEIKIKKIPRFSMDKRKLSDIKD